jgi:hypothetical protein
MQRISGVLLALITVFLALSAPALAADAGGTVDLDKDILASSAKAITILFVLAVLVENALAVLFNSRIFLTYFSLRGIKSIISIAASYLVVTKFDQDVFASLLSTYKSTPVASGPVSQILTALILSGGSGGVNNLMTALGYRSRAREAEVNPQTAGTQAWVAIWLKRHKAVGPVHVHVTKLASPTTDPAAIAGTVGARRPNLWQLLLRNPNRFPANGGYVVEPGEVYAITVTGTDAAGNEIQDDLGGKAFRFAPGAIVDFQASL